MVDLGQSMWLSDGIFTPVRIIYSPSLTNQPLAYPSVICNISADTLTYCATNVFFLYFANSEKDAIVWVIVKHYMKFS